MNIFGSDITNRSHLNRMGNQQNTHITRSGQVDGASESSRASSGSELQPGQVFEGEIVDITPKNVSIRLSNQQVMNARLGESMELSIGQKMVFEVKENAGDQVVIHPKPDANMSGQNMAAIKALTANGLTVSDRNVQIAGALMEAGLPLNKESMRQIMQQSMNYPEANIKNLVSMNQLQIPVNSVNVSQFEAYVNHEHQMTNAIHQVMDGLEQSLSEIMQGSDVDSIQEFTKELTRIFGWGESGAETGETTMTDPTGNHVASEVGNTEVGITDAGIPEQTVGEQGIESSKLIEGSLPGQEDGSKVSGEWFSTGQGISGSDTDTRNGSGQSLPIQETIEPENPAIGQKGSSNGESAVLSGMEAPEQMASAEGNSVQDAMTGQQVSSASILEQAGTDQELLQSLRNQMVDAGIPEDTIHQMLEQSKSYGELAANITNYLADPNQYIVNEQMTAPDKTSTKQLLQSDSFRKLLKKAVQDEWLMKPSEMKSPKEIDEFYKKMLRQASDLEQSLNSGGSGNKQFSESASNMRDNIQFMQQLNEQFVYAQMPMNMSGTEANSELFVYANKKKLQQNTDGVKVLLHLDMPNLGSTDILVRLKDKKLHASFRMEDNTSISVVADNMGDLQNKLESKGFIFTNEVVRQEVHKSADQPEVKNQKSDAVVDEMLNQDLVTGMKRFTFDIRG